MGTGGVTDVEALGIVDASIVSKAVGPEEGAGTEDDEVVSQQLHKTGTYELRLAGLAHG